MRTNLIKLKEDYRNAKTEKDFAEIKVKMQELIATDHNTFATCMTEMAKETADKAEEISVREQIKEILPAVSMSYIAKNYFGKTRQWLYQRVNGTSVNGKPSKMTIQEAKILETAFKDLGNKLSALQVY